MVRMVLDFMAQAVDRCGVALAVAVLLLMTGGVARAQVSCSVSSGFAFGTLNVASASPTYSSGNATMTCNSTIGAPTTAYVCLSLGTGTGGTTGSDRALSSGANKIPLQLKESIGSSTQVGNDTTWPSSTVKTLNLPATGSASVVFPLVAIVPGNLNPLPVAGTYSTTFTGTDFVVAGSLYPTSSCATVKSTAAQTLSSSMTITATVVNQCGVTAQPLNFGTASFLNSAVDASSTIQVLCNTSNTPVTLGLDLGSNGGTGPTARKMAYGGNTVTYGLYWNAARTTPAGSVVSGGQALTVTGSATALVYGRVPAQASVPPGTYTDVIGVTLTY